MEQKVSRILSGAGIIHEKQFYTEMFTSQGSAGVETTLNYWASMERENRIL